MISKEKKLVVVALVEGRNFPRRPRFHLVAEAKFDGEVLATDPVHHEENPLIEQELGWSLDAKTLHQYRLQRTAIRVQLYAVDSHTTAKETIGYVTLDLRSATNRKSLKWCSVLHSRYSRREGTRSVKPEMHIGIYLDEDQQPLGGHPGAVNATELEPILNEAEGYYQLGNYKVCSERFLISVTVASAKNLTQLIPSDVPLPSAGTGFYFHFKLFGNPVVNEPFTDLVRPNFPPERSSVRVRSTLEVLRAYFLHNSPITLYLCCGQQTLGLCAIPIHNIFKEGADFSQPVSIEGVFSLCRPEAARDEAPAEGEQPAVGVCVTLRRDLPQPVKRGTHGKGEDSGLIEEPEPVQLPLTPKAEAEDEELRQAHRRAQRARAEDGGHRRAQRARAEEEEEEEAHRFSFTLDVSTVRDLQVRDSQPRFVYVRYVYPFFGSATPVLTHPPVELRRHQEAMLPQGLCEFQLAVRPSELRAQLAAEPLALELRQHDRERATRDLLGAARLDLSPALDGADVAVDVPVRAQGAGARVAELSVRFALVDLGPVGSAAASPQPSPGPVKEDKPPKSNAPNPRPADPPDSPRQRTPTVRETPEYKAAVELELWKQAAEEEFQQKLAAECSKRLKSISQEWQKREKEREMLIKKKTAELQSMKSELESTSRDLENREKQVAHKEMELTRLRQELTREHERKVNEARDGARRLEQDCEHKVALERTKTKHLVDQLEQAKQEAAEWERRFRACERDLLRTRERQSHTPEARLQAELAAAHSERADLERRLEAAAVAKERYKLQYVNTLKELARVRKRERGREAEAVRRRERELAHLRLRHLAAEERSLGAGREAEAARMEELRRGIEALREETKSALSQMKEEKQAERTENPTVSGDAATNEYLQQLMRVRESLLKDSLYDPEDLVVQELEQRIRDAMQAGTAQPAS